MIGRSWAAATPEERGQDDQRDALALIENPPDEEPARAEHDPIPDMVERNGVSYQVDRCRKCGVWAPRADDACPGENYTLEAFTDGEAVSQRSRSRPR